MLKQRLITAVVLIPLTIWAILSLSNLYFALLLAVLTAIATWEWAALAGLSSGVERACYILVVVLSLWGAYYLPLLPVLVMAFLWWLVGFWWVLRFPADIPLWSNSPIRLLAGILVLVPSWLALVVMHADAKMGPTLVLFLIGLIWAADSGAYFAGRRWGSVKLAPRISPGKTWMGVLGAAVATSLLAVVGGIALASGKIALFVLLCLVTLLFSVVGDLLESMFKRRIGVKDSGTLLPGHGGILDRIDSLTAAAPVFVLGLITLGIPE